MITKQIAWNTGSGNITLTYQGQGDGIVTIESDANDGAARSQVINIETTAGSPVITKNLTIRQGASPVPVGTVLNYAYTGSYQEVELPAGQYKLQCWGAQGGSNAAASSYSITAQAGGKGGYSEGIITLSQATTLRVYVGGQGSSSAGGFNGGGSTPGSSTYNGGDTYGTSRMGGGGGATDIRLSDGALLSRMIVAGGGSGGAATYRAKTTWKLIYTKNVTSEYQSNNNRTITTPRVYDFPTGKENARLKVELTNLPVSSAKIEFTLQTSGYRYPSYNYGSPFNFVSYNYTGAYVYVFWSGNIPLSGTQTLNVYEAEVTEDTYSQIGYYGGGINGGAAYSDFKATQNSAGQGGSFGLGAGQTNRYSRHASGAGGAGWYGGGAGATDAYISSVNYMGGGSGFVNTSASSGNRPSGYTGLQLDSGTTYAGNTSFPSTSGGTETGHSGNGYARITRLS